jgi:hypothetical protein
MILFFAKIMTQPKITKYLQQFLFSIIGNILAVCNKHILETCLHTTY